MSLRAVADDELDEAAVTALRHHTDAAVRAETARELFRRLAHLEHDAAVDHAVAPHLRRPPPRLQYPRWGFRKAVKFAVERRMFTPEYLTLYRRFLQHRARALATGRDIVFQGMVFTGKRVEFHARPDHGRLVVGPWCWIGNDNKLRAHQGQLTLGSKVVMGRDNVINTYLDVDLGDFSLYADWIYICDFDHRFTDLTVPLKDQGIVKSPVRVGSDVWVGEKASILRGVDIGHGSVIASHCLVNRDIPPFSIVVGVPARIVNTRLPKGVDPEEALDLLRRGEPIVGDPLEG